MVFFKKYILLSLVIFSQLITTKDNPYNKTYYAVDFDRGMASCHDFLTCYTQLLEHPVEGPRLKLFRDHYTKNLFSIVKPSPTPKIPKIIHQIWLGSPYPERFRKLQQTWLDEHPDWEFRVWTDADIDSFPFTNKQFFDKTSNYGEKADIWRYEILYQIGGLYIDIDVECLKAFDILHHTYNFFVGLEPAPCGGPLANCVIGASPGHPILNRIIEEIAQRRHEENIYDRTGPRLLADIVYEMLEDAPGINIVLPSNYFCPFGIGHDPKTRWWVRPESFAAHYWMKTWDGGLAVPEWIKGV